MSEKLKDTAIDLLLDGVKKKIDDMRDNHKWQELFVNTGHFFINNSDMVTRFESDLYLVFSEDNLKTLAKKLRNKSGYEFPELLHEELYDLMIRYEIPAMQAETHIHHFMKVIINYLEENDPDRALELYLGHLKKEIDQNFSTIEEKFELVLSKIAELNEAKVVLYSVSDIDVQIRRMSKYKGMGLDFFELDDEQFESRFQSAINKELIYIVGKSREETTYRILNELRQKYPDRVTLIVKSEAEWSKLQETGISGNILVPFFYAEQIVAIPNNNNIFVYGEDEPCYARDKIILRRRTKRNIINALEKIGVNYREAYNMVDNTHGLYIPLRKKLFNVAEHDNQLEWVKNHSDVVMAALLCGKWTEATGDVLIFEELSGKSYEECKKELERYLYMENPFIVHNISRRERNLQLASIEDAWEQLDIYITDELWDKFISLFKEVLIESEPIFEYPFEKHFEASIYAEKPEWSQTLKRGMIRTLLMRAFYKGHEKNQKQIDHVISQVLDTITNKERWGYISQYITDLCEASPESVLRKLKDELEHPQGMVELFEENDGDIITGRHYYTNVLWAVEQLIQQKKYVVQAVEWLWKVDSYNLKYSISNSPRTVLDIVFCAWLNECALSVDEKIRLAEKAIKNYPNAWDIIVSRLPQGTDSICSPLNTPKYRAIDEPDILYNQDVHKIYIKYLKMCVDSADVDVEKWEKLIQRVQWYEMSIQNEVLEKLILSCRGMADKEKLKIKNQLRFEIYRHRYFSDADWSLPEEVLGKYESTMNEIVFSDKIYEYMYLFSPEFEFPLLHPVSYSREKHNESADQNQRLREEEIRVGFKEFKENKYSLDKLIELAVQEDNILGEVLAQFYSDGMFDEEVFHLLMRKDKERKHVFDYVRYLHRYGSVDLKDVIEMVKRISDNKNLLVNLISLEFIEDDVNALIAKEDEEIKTMYWSRNTRARISDHAGHQVFLWALNECEKYGTCDNYFELLYDVREKISIQELYDATVKISDMKGGIASSMTIYYIGEILKELQDAFITDDEKCAEIVSVEWLCRNILEWKQMRCLQKEMKNDPKIYADLVGIVYKAEDDESEDKEKCEVANAVYSAFDKARFCPAEKDGKVSYEVLKKWVEELKGLLIKQKQENLFGHLLGRLLAYSPIGADSYHPCEAVRKIIEEYDSDSLRSSYIVAEENKRGVHTVDAGKSELILHQRYLNNAEGLQAEYPKTAEIYFTLSEDYKREAEYERKRAEDEW